MKKYFILIIIYFVFSNSHSKVVKEDFNEFFLEFNENIDFQKDRIVFPFIEEYYSDDEGADTTFYKNKADWKTHFYLLDTCNGIKKINYLTYGSESITEIDSITYHSSLVDAYSNSHWCFKRRNGKWFLVKRISYS